MTSRRSTKAQKRSLDRLATAPENISPTASSEQLLFSGLHFYFFPNSRTNRARALRIDKATQYGATFCPQWSSKVTHIIMDDGMQYEEFMKYHKDLVSVPENVILINGRYVADCMSYGVILTHNQRLYQVPGRQTVEEARSKLKKVASEPSLSAKATKTTEGPLHRSMTEQAPSGSNIRPYETQEYNSIVDLIGRPTTLRMESLSADCIDPEAPNNTGVYDDDLTAMIGEAKAIAHLPIEMEGDEATLNSSFANVPPPSAARKEASTKPQSTTIAPATSQHDPMIMQRPSDGKWVKLRCKECGEANFQDIRGFLKHSAFLHKQRFKTQDEAIEECGFPLKSYLPTQDISTCIGLPATSTGRGVETSNTSRGIPREDTQEPLAKRAKTSWQDQFSCMGTHDGSTKGENPNADTIEQLQEMADFYERTNNRWRSLSFRRGISTLRKQTRRITTKEEALKLPFVGDSLAEAIEMIVQTGGLSRLEATKDDPLNKVLQLFMGIYGVGLSQATKWVSVGLKTLDDLRVKAQLNENQMIGLEHYDDLQQRIPRAEVEAHGEIFRSTLAGIDSAFEVTIGGSYRRGSPTSGDIDLIITKPGASLHKVRSVILDHIIPELFAMGFLKAELARTSSNTGSKWHGCSAIDGGPWRRIDFLLVPWDEMGAALIYFTGNDIFNRSIRLLASRKGMRLNQRGLYKDVLRGKGTDKVTKGGLLESKSEKKLFEILGVPWRPPEHRNC